MFFNFLFTIFSLDFFLARFLIEFPLFFPLMDAFDNDQLRKKMKLLLEIVVFSVCFMHIENSLGTARGQKETGYL